MFHYSYSLIYIIIKCLLNEYYSSILIETLIL